MNEIHEAAARLREVAATKNGCMVYNTNADAAVVHMRADQERLSDAMLRELDPTPVCESALGAFTFVTEGVSLESEDGEILLVQTAQDESGFRVCHHLESIGHLRTLCRYLGIELKE